MVERRAKGNKVSSGKSKDRRKKGRLESGGKKITKTEEARLSTVKSLGEGGKRSRESDSVLRE